VRPAGDGPASILSAAKKRELVTVRAGDRCEYCKVYEPGQVGTFHVEHIIPTSRGGSDEVDNLAWSCSPCNLSKSNRLELRDPESGYPAPMFHTRTMSWEDHFEWSGYMVVGRTPTGRALILALDMNSAKRVRIRTREQLLGDFPPPLANSGA
jgi:hypothetical protein